MLSLDGCVGKSLRGQSGRKATKRPLLSAGSSWHNGSYNEDGDMHSDLAYILILAPREFGWVV